MKIPIDTAPDRARRHIAMRSRVPVVRCCTMWQRVGLVAALLSIGALLIVACGGESKNQSQACPRDFRTKFPDSPSAVSLKEARKRSQFGVGLPTTLPAGVSLSSVAIDPDPGCPNKRINDVQLFFSGPGYSFNIWERPPEVPSLSSSASRFE